VVTVGEITLDVPARPEYLSLVRQVVAAAAGVQTVRDERIEALRLAVSEATTNAIEAYADFGGDGTTQRVVIRCNLDHDQVEVEVSDQGGGFDPGQMAGFPEPGGGFGPERGRGVPLMRHFADESDITVGDGGTSVRLVVYTPWRTPPAGT
jgi:serine/threonine-protein kinase RsbW